MLRRRQKGKSNSQSGMSLIELLFAGFILVIGMMGSLTLITLSILSNTRNKTDTTGTMLAQLVIEQMNTLPTSNPVTTIKLTDCVTIQHPTATTWILATTGDTVANGGAGAGLITNPSDPSYARIDYNAASPRDYAGLTGATAPSGNYAMKYHTCGDVEYDVRWNIQNFTKGTRILTVAARQSGATTKNILIFAPPVNLRTVQGP